VKLEGIAWSHSQFTTYPAVQPRVVLEEAEDTLEGFLTKRDALTWDCKLQICIDIAKGLASLHSSQIIHGDLTSRNILMFKEHTDGTQTSAYRAKVADFGHSYFNGTRERAPRGTEGYEAFEVRDGQINDNPKATDIYSLGVIIWMVLIHPYFDKSYPEPHPVLADVTEEDDSDIDHLLRTVFVDEQNHADEYRVPLVQGLIRTTLRYLPQNRNLESTIEGLMRLKVLRDLDAGSQSRTRPLSSVNHG
jgi:serine/threonine protein kinase